MTQTVRSVARALRGALVIVMLVVIQVASAGAHAALNASSPGDGSVVAVAPSSYTLTFSEPVSVLVLKIVEPDGSSRPLDRFVLKDQSLEIAAPDGLGRGTHVLSWRVVSSDGHPVGGSVVFSIGAASATAPLVGDDIDWTVRAGLWLSKVAVYVGLFIGVGGAFAIRVLMPGVSAGRRVVTAAIGFGLLGALLSIGFQGLDALDAPVSRVLQPGVWSTGLATRYGDTVIAAMAALVLGATAIAVRSRTAQVAAWAALVAGALALAISGHASAATPQWLMRPAVFLHVLAIEVWIGALAPLGLALKRGQAEAPGALRRFSTFIAACVAALVAAGIALAVVQVAQPGALFDTAYGRVFLFKLALLAPLFLLAAVNRWWFTDPAIAGDGIVSRRLARSVAVESLIALLILATVAAWRFTPPPRVLIAQASLPASVHIHGDKAMVDLSITPGRPGPVTVVANLLSGDFGPIDPQEVSIVFSSPNAGIEPFRRSLQRAGAGEWRAESVTIPLPGPWRVRLDVLITDFDMVRLQGEVTIRP